MKILLAMAMTTVFTGAAFGACGVNTLEDCTDKVACENLSSGNIKYEFNEKAKLKCMLKETSVATNCLENNSSNIKAEKTEAGGTAATTETGAAKK